MISQHRLHLLSPSYPFGARGGDPSETRTRVRSNGAHAIQVNVCFAVNGVQ